MSHQNARQTTKHVAKPAPNQSTSKHTVHQDAASKPQAHRGDASKPGPTNFVAVPHHDPKSGYKGKFVPKTPATQKRAQELLQKMNMPITRSP